MTGRDVNPYRAPLDDGDARQSTLGRRGCVAGLIVVGIGFILMAAEFGFKVARAACDAFNHPEVNSVISDPQFAGFAVLVFLLEFGSGLAFVVAAWTVHQRSWRLTACALAAGVTTAFYWGYLLNKTVTVFS